MTREVQDSDSQMRPHAEFSEAGEAQLAVALGRGRRDALAEVYERHSGAVFEVARTLCDERGATAVVQQAFLDLWHAPEDFDPADTIRAHLVRRAHAAAAERGTHGPPSPAARPDTERVPTRDRSHPPSAAAEDAWPLLAGLPGDERQAVWMTYFMGYSAREVATRLQQPDRVVHQRITAGLRRLRALHETTAGADPPR